MKKTFLTAAATLLATLTVASAWLTAVTPAFAAENVDSDEYAGTLQYKVTERGQSVEISYNVNGETVTYTVPNNANYTSGPMAAIDDLDRTMYTSESENVGAYGSTGERYVGLFYFLWHGEHGDNGAFDLQKIIDKVGVSRAGSLSCGLYGPVGAMHWFAEPLYGYYYANDEWVLRKHAELLTNANIDFLYFDVTNGYTYLSNALKLMKCLHELNEQGFDAPQVVFYTHTNAHTVIRDLYNNVYKANKYPDTWFCIDGKPVMIGPEDANINGFFTMKQDQWPTESTKSNSWPWMDFTWPQRLFRSGGEDGGAMSVSIAQHSGTVTFSDSSLYGNPSNRGRSFAEKRAMPASLKKAYEAWEADPSLTMQGLNFQAQFDTAIKSKAMYILVTGWNEWVAQRQPSQDNREIYFVDTSSMEFSRDAEMMRGGYFDNYYVQLAYNVQRVKGAVPTVVQDARHKIDVQGDFDQWEDVTVTYTDPKGDTADRNATGFGRTKYQNTSGRNDIVAAKVTSDTQNVYFYVKTAAPITAADKDSSWMKLYLNTDGESSGWHGFDYIVNYAPKNASTTTVAKYSGRNDSYHFKEVGEVSYRVEGNEMMVAVPQSMLECKGYLELCMQFKWADSETSIDEMEDFYCDGDAAPLGRMNFVYQNYIPGVSEIKYPWETDAPTEAPTDPETDPDTTPDTDAPTDEEVTTGGSNSLFGGCSGFIGAVGIIPLTAALSAAYVLRKRRS